MVGNRELWNIISTFWRIGIIKVQSKTTQTKIFFIWVVIFVFAFKNYCWRHNNNNIWRFTYYSCWLKKGVRVANLLSSVTNSVSFLFPFFGISFKAFDCFVSPSLIYLSSLSLISCLAKTLKDMLKKRRFNLAPMTFLERLSTTSKERLQILPGDTAMLILSPS